MIWIDIRCDAQYEESGCYSYRNNGPNGNPPTHGRRHILEAVGRLEREAIRQGWKIRRRVGLTCPACVAYEEKGLHNGS